MMVDLEVLRNLEWTVKEVEEMEKENDKVVEDKMMMNLEPPTTPMVISLLTNMYWITMAYA